MDNRAETGFFYKEIFFKFSVLHKKIGTVILKIPSCGGTQSPGLVNRESFHKPAVFLPGEKACFTSAPGPLETPGIQPHIKQYKACFIMIQRLNPVRFPSAEEVQRIGVRVHLVCIPDYRHEAVDGKPHIRTSCYKEDF